MPLFDDPPLRDFPDRAMRRLLEDPANLGELLGAVQPELSRHLDFSRVEPVKRTFLMEDWRERECDLFFRVPYRTPTMEQWILVCILLEHQSAPDPRMPLRLLIYAALYWEGEWKHWEDRHQAYEPLRLTPIVPIVFYTGQTAWTASRNLADLIAGPDEFRPFAPQWQTLFWNLSEQDPEVLLSSAEAWLQALAVVRTEGEELATFQGVLRRVLPRLERLCGQQRIRALDLLWFVLSWALRRRPRRERKELEEIIRASLADPEAQKEVATMSKSLDMTWEQEMRVIAEERAKVMAQGMAEERAKVMAEERARVLAEEWAKAMAEERAKILAEERAKVMAEERAKVLAEERAKVMAEAMLQEWEKLVLLRLCRDNLRALLQERFGVIPDTVLQRIEACDDLERLKAALRQIVHINAPEELQV
jgi:hypothetical protein